MHLLIDGVTFQRGDQSSAGWSTVLEQLGQHPNVVVTLLDRGGAPTVPEVRQLPFPEALTHDEAADSLLIQRICEQYKADVFLSTGTTNPVATPALAVVPMCLGDRADEEDATAVLAFAMRYICTTEEARVRLLAAFPGIPSRRISSSLAEPTVLAAAILTAARELLTEGQHGHYDEFFKEWTRIRRIHAAVAWNATWK